MTGSLTSGYIKPARLYYEIQGAGSNVVFLHAGFVDGRMWDPQWNEFGSRHRVMRYDMEGYGWSASGPQPVLRREELHQILHELRLDRVILVACSLGGSTAVNFALDYPEKVRALVLVSTLPEGFPFQGQPPVLMGQMIQALNSGNDELANELQLRLWFDGPFREPSQVDPALREKAALMNRILIQRKTLLRKPAASPEPGIRTSAWERLGELAMPILIVTGTLDDPEIQRGAELMNQRIPGSSLRMIDGAAHLPSFEQPADFNAVLRDFLETVDSPVHSGREYTS